MRSRGASPALALATRFASTPARLLSLAALALGATTPSCTDPVLDKAVDRLGKETQNVDKGPYHRPGQPCLLCHQEGGSASNAPFTVAGTIFAQPNRWVGVESAEVRMTDAEGTKYIAKTNCTGNFFVKPEEWNPHFPILVEVGKGSVRRSMKSVIGREGSCAGCHAMADPDPLSQVGHIDLFAGDEPGFPNGSDKDCPVDPVVPGTP